MSNNKEDGNGFVNGIRGLIDKAQREQTHSIRPFKDASPAQIIHYELRNAVVRYQHKLHDQRKADFFETLSDAWDALAVEAYTADITREDAYDKLYFRHKRALEPNDPNAAVIPLSPAQTRIIDILADAADIPNPQKGRQYIPIPPKSRRTNYWSE
jgi:hypothetical protein